MKILQRIFRQFIWGVKLWAMTNGAAWAGASWRREEPRDPGEMRVKKTTGKFVSDGLKNMPKLKSTDISISTSGILKNRGITQFCLAFGWQISALCPLPHLAYSGSA